MKEGGHWAEVRFMQRPHGQTCPIRIHDVAIINVIQLYLCFPFCDDITVYAVKKIIIGYKVIIKVITVGSAVMCL